MTLLNDRPGGSSVYATALVGALRARADLDVQTISATGTGALGTLRWIASEAARSVRKTGALVLHSPAFLTPLSAGVPTVLTIHDLALGRMPEGQAFEWRMYYRWLVPRLTRKSRFIVTPTEATRQDVMSLFHVPADRVVVTPEGVDARFFVAAGGNGETAGDPPVLLFPGPPLGRKNLDLVLSAMAGASRGSRLAAARLQISGATAEEFPAYGRRIREAGLQERIVWLGKLPFGDMPALYSRADLVVYPSFLEGFGLPPLEAMAAGTPVVASNSSCLPEVLDGAAVLVDPHDAVAFAHAVESAVSDAELRKRLVAAGSARARQFTWSRCAELTAAVYRKAAG
jgi:glycosyltransferase involved in cell wall biosynthesis